MVTYRGRYNTRVKGWIVRICLNPKQSTRQTRRSGDSNAQCLCSVGPLYHRPRMRCAVVVALLLAQLLLSDASAMRGRDDDQPAQTETNRIVSLMGEPDTAHGYTSDSSPTPTPADKASFASAWAVRENKKAKKARKGHGGGRRRRRRRRRKGVQWEVKSKGGKWKNDHHLR